MTVKAGQKCTAIRRAMAPAQYLDAVEQALGERLAKTKVGDPRAEDTRMGALVSVSQRDDVREQDRASSRPPARASSPAIPTPSRRLPGGAFLPPVLLRTDDPWGTDAVHDCEPFGPVSTIMPYKDMADAIALANRGKGSLVLSLFTHSPDAAREFVQGAAAYHGRMLVHRPRQCRRIRPVTARRCRCSSTAAPAAPAAARRWAAFAASSITCSAPRSSPRRR